MVVDVRTARRIRRDFRSRFRKVYLRSCVRRKGCDRVYRMKIIHGDLAVCIAGQSGFRSGYCLAKMTILWHIW